MLKVKESTDKSESFLKKEKIRFDKLNEVIGDIDLTSNEEKTLIWLCETLEDYSLDNIISVMKKIKPK